MVLARRKGRAIALILAIVALNVMITVMITDNKLIRHSGGRAAAFDHGEVGSVHFSVVKLLLQFALRCGVLRQHHHAGRVLVKPVDDVTPSVLVLML